MGKNIWKSEPKLKGMAARNLSLPLAIPLSGATYTKMALSEIVNLKREEAIYNIQNMNLFPVINEGWETKQNSVSSELQFEDLWLSGDGRWYSPRQSA